MMNIIQSVPKSLLETIAISLMITQFTFCEYQLKIFIYITLLGIILVSYYHLISYHLTQFNKIFNTFKNFTKRTEIS